jgi:hypothetical protein
MQASKFAWCLLVATGVAAPSGRALAGSPKYHHHKTAAQQDEDRDRGDHYRDRGAKPSRAEQLGVAIRVRSLLDKGGKTDFELSTAPLDSSAPAPGNVDNAKVRAVRADAKKKLFETEYEHLRGGGYVHYAWTGLAHGQYLEVKTHVSGFGKGKEALSFKLGVPVLYRPDLAVQSLQYATVVRPNTFVTFQAVIAERMRDVGAHTDCELLVDGTRVDVAPQMWVDANSAVSCLLTYKFPASGKHTVAVRAANVTPGDFDASNNQMSGDIVVDDPAQIFYTASVDDVVDVMDSVTNTYASAASTTPDQRAQTTVTSQIQNRIFSGSIPVPVKLPLARISYSDTSDGRSLSSLNYTNVSTTESATSCASGDPAFPVLTTITLFDAASNGQVILRVYQNPQTGAGKTTVDMTWSFADASYVSAGFCNSVASTTLGCTAGDWTDSGSFGSTGLKLPLGSSYSANVVVDDGTAYTAQPSMQLTSTRTVQPLSDPFCFSTDFPMTCMQFADDTVARHGEDSHLQ